MAPDICPELFREEMYHVEAPGTVDGAEVEEFKNVLPPPIICPALLMSETPYTASGQCGRSNSKPDAGE
jgi:hypothetical protein